MASEKLRKRIVFEAARLVSSRQETDCHKAKIRAARKLCRGWLKPSQLPSDEEVLDEIQRLVAPDDESLDQDFDRFDVYRSLLLPLEHVELSRRRHPEGDALYHSLQVFTLVHDKQPYDEELLLAGLLHDVGKAIEPYDHVAAGLDALEGTITERTAWLIEHHSEAHRIHDGTIGVRARKRLAASPDYADLLLLGECDRNGRVPGMRVPDLDEALDVIRELSTMCG